PASRLPGDQGRGRRASGSTTATPCLPEAKLALIPGPRRREGERDLRPGVASTGQRAGAGAHLGPWRKAGTMLRKKEVEFFAPQSGVSLEIAEREVVLTHALQLLSEAGRLEHFAFKGGTCIRKIHLGATGRFSMDLDFTACKPM